MIINTIVIDFKYFNITIQGVFGYIIEQCQSVEFILNSYKYNFDYL